MTENLLAAAAVALLAFLVLRFVLARRARIDGPTARAKVDAGAQLIDVRTAAELAAGALPGALHVPVQDLASRLEELPRDRPLVVYCASGMRSARASAVLRSAGFEVDDLGPMRAW